MSNLPFRLSQARILLVDDSEFDTSLVASALGREGFKNIEAAKDGVDALEKTRLFRPELVMLDLKMPNLDGFGYCELVRKDHTLSRMPIIVQTSADDRETKIRALSCGVDDFLNKPFDPVELGLRARIHLSRYFMLQDANEMCIYLKWELEEAKSVMQRVQESNLSNVTQYRLHRHYEALEAMSLISIVAT